MRRTDLAVGAELYYCRSTRWMTSDQFGKAVVVAVEPYRQPGGTAGYSMSAPVKTTKGPGVLVDLFTVDFRGDLSPKATRRVVSLTALHGPYEETRAMVEVQLRVADALVDVRTKVRAELTDRALVLIDRARQLGVRVVSEETSAGLGYLTPAARVIQISLDEFEHVLQRLEECQ